MPTDSNFAHLDARQRGRITFDPTINAGHLLTFLGFLLSGFMAHSTLDKRVAVVELHTNASSNPAARGVEVISLPAQKALAQQLPTGTGMTAEDLDHLFTQAAQL